jgi:hypothetical protein
MTINVCIFFCWVGIPDFQIQWCHYRVLFLDIVFTTEHNTVIVMAYFRSGLQMKVKSGSRMGANIKLYYNSSEKMENRK